MKAKPTLTLVTQPQEYFYELITEALSHHRFSPSPETEYYLVNLLNQFMTTDRLYPTNVEDGTSREEPPYVMIQDALEAPVPHRGAMFRHLGDVSLYTAGFFQDSLNRKLVDLDYYINVGETAYKNAAGLGEEARRNVYLELADRFSSFVDVLAEVSDKTTPKTEKDLLRLYDVWLRTRSERAAKALQEAGIIPADTTKKDWQ